MKMCINGLVVMAWLVSVAAARVVVLPDLIHPDSMAVDESRIYITEDIAVLIYDRASLELQVKIGKEGEGPQEFLRNRQSGMPPLTIALYPDRLLVNSLNKISFFTKEGRFLEERKVVDRGDRFQPLGNGFAGEGDRRDEKVRRVAVNIYDARLNRVTEVFSFPHPFQGVGSGFRVLDNPRAFVTCADRLFVAMDEALVVRVFDEAGRSLRVVEKDYRRRDLTGADREWIDTYFRTDPRMKDLYPLIKPIHYPETFPAIRQMLRTDDEIYILTWKREGALTECFVMGVEDLDMRRIMLPIVYVDLLDIYPAAIDHGTLYQLVENDDEAWELHVTVLET